MRKKSRRVKNEERKRHFDVFKDLMSTFTMATVAVVAVVTLIPASPKAEIIKSVALSKEIIYQVNVTDEENALDLSTLFVVLENQLEYYEKSITLGENSGYFDSLENSTEYRLSVYGNKGFGQERLDTLMITTNEKVGGAILSVTPNVVTHSTNYIVDLSVFDPDSKYTSINLYYGYRWEHDSKLIYSSINITASNMNIELNDVNTSEVIHIYLEGTTLSGTEMLDEIWVTPQFKLNTSVYMHYLNSTKVSFSIYKDMVVDNIKYEMNVFKNGLLMKTESITLEENSYDNNELIIDGLSPNSTYDFECVAIYINPQTLSLERVMVYQEEVTTLNVYTYNYYKDIVDEYIEVTITLSDPNNYFQEVYYESYDTSGEYDIYLFSESYLFNDNGIEKNISFTIYIPTVSAYEITIVLRNEFDTLVKQKIDIITFE